MNLQNYPIALALRGVSKRFDRPAVDALDLTVYGGEVYALVGPNGAGKTTTLRTVVGLLRPDAGWICIEGIDALSDFVAAKQMTARLSDEPMIYDKLTPYEYLDGQGGPNVEIARPNPIISAPQITVHLVPTLSAIRPITMPPIPEPSQASALASAGMERTPSTSAAMSLSATAVIHAAPNAISMVTSATVATAQEALVSIEENGDCNITL